MYCEHCGNKLNGSDKFCTKCGNVVISDSHHKHSDTRLSDDRWWNRLLKVAYILSYLPLILILPLVWIESTPYYSSYSQQYYGSYGEAIWYSLLTLVIYAVLARLVKIAVLYVVSGRKPQWKREFKKFY